MAVESVTLNFRDNSANPVPYCAYSIGGATNVTGPSGTVTVSLADGTYTVLPVSTASNLFAPASITVNVSNTAFTFTALAPSSAASVDRTAAYLVGRVRDLMEEKGSQQIYRDGFVADLAYADGSKSILEALNVAQRKAARTGYYKCYFTQALTAATSDSRNNEYEFATKIHRVLSVVLFDATGLPYPLREVNYGSLDIMRGQWRAQNSGRPSEYYTYGNVIGFNPAPDMAYTVQVLANSVAPDMVNPNDTPQKLAAYFHDMLSYGGALELSSNAVTNEDAQKRVPYLGTEWAGYMEELLRVSQTRPIESVTSIRPGDLAKRRA